jgi:hypothetical protein
MNQGKKSGRSVPEATTMRTIKTTRRRRRRRKRKGSRRRRPR